MLYLLTTRNHGTATATVVVTAGSVLDTVPADTVRRPSLAMDRHKVRPGG